MRLDDSDEHVFRSCGAASEGEWVVSGGYAVCDFDRDPRCSPPCHCESSFVALASLTSVTSAIEQRLREAELEEQVQALAWHLVKNWGAPSWEAAHAVAEEEVRHTAEVCETLAPEVWITVKRARRGDDDALEEQYAVYDRLLIGNHRL